MDRTGIPFFPSEIEPLFHSGESTKKVTSSPSSAIDLVGVLAPAIALLLLLLPHL